VRDRKKVTKETRRRKMGWCQNDLVQTKLSASEMNRNLPQTYDLLSWAYRSLSETLVSDNGTVQIARYRGRRWVSVKWPALQPVNNHNWSHCMVWMGASDEHCKRASERSMPHYCWHAGIDSCHQAPVLDHFYTPWCDDCGGYFAIRNGTAKPLANSN